MTPVFPEWSNSLIRWVLVLIVAVLVGIPLLLMAYVRTPFGTGQYDPLEQPVQFDHRHHVADQGIDCFYCHHEAERSPYAGVPSSATCMGCHNQLWRDSSLLEPVRASFFSGDPVPWRRVHALPDFVYFDHSAHVNRNVGCVSCHGVVSRMPAVQQQAPMTMAWCLDCHRDPDPHLRPSDRITHGEWRPDGDPRAFGRDIRERHEISPPLTCTACHR
jgi:hypothetical protein